MQTTKRRKDSWIGHILHTNCLLKHVFECRTKGKKKKKKVVGTGRRRRKQLVDDLMEKRRCGKSKEEALYCTLWRINFGKDNGLVVRQTA